MESKKIKARMLMTRRNELCKANELKLTRQYDVRRGKLKRSLTQQNEVYSKSEVKLQRA